MTDILLVREELQGEEESVATGKGRSSDSRKKRPLSMCNQKGGVKIQNRGPEQEIPAVTCVRLIAQKHRY